MRIRQELISIEPRQKSTQRRRPNCMLKDYVETNEKGQIAKERGRGFVVIGGIKYYLE